jgi:uncharacterized membrane protein (DUF485 family)
MSIERKERRRNAGDLAVTALVAAVYFVYLLVWVGAPKVFARPVVAGHAAPWGLVAGALVIVAIMAVAAIYMDARNRDDGGDAP